MSCGPNAPKMTVRNLITRLLDFGLDDVVVVEIGDLGDHGEEVDIHQVFCRSGDVTVIQLEYRNAPKS